MATDKDPLVEKARAIAEEIAGRFATEVDRDARFPRETVDALRGERLLGAYVDPDLGGLGCDLRALMEMCQALGRRCASSAMIFAMHQIQVACLARHGRGGSFRDYLGRLVSERTTRRPPCTMTTERPRGP